MLENLKKEMNNFFKDLDENIKDKEELLYVKQRTSDLVDFMAGEIEKIMDYKEDKLNALIKKQEQADRLIQELNDKMDNVYEDIYDEEIKVYFIKFLREEKKFASIEKLKEQLNFDAKRAAKENILVME